MVINWLSVLVEMNSSERESSPIIRCSYGFVMGMPGKFRANVVEAMKIMKKTGEEDPRRIVHSVKVGLALTLISLFYFLRPLYDGFGQAGMWAVITVVSVFQFRVGGTLSKSLNRGLATLVAATLGVGAVYLADVAGEKAKPVVVGFLVFILAAASTFTRCFPKVRSKYDYGVLIFMLTFSLVAISGIQVSQIIEMGRDRVITILIGGATCVIISVFVCPVWAGQDLHNLVASSLENLAVFLDRHVGGIRLASQDDDKSFLISYESILSSKATEESLANFAWWEVGHSRFRSRHPWKQYLKVGDLIRQCACQIERLHRHVNSKPQETSEFHRKIQKPCAATSKELGEALKELSSAIKNLIFPPSAVGIYLQNSRSSANDLKHKLQNSLTPKADIEEVMQAFVVVALLIDIIEHVEKISMSVHELSEQALFQKPKRTDQKQLKQLRRCGIVKPVIDYDNEVAIDIFVSFDELPENKNTERREREEEVCL